MKLQPWYKVVTPREDLRQARPLDAAEFAIHLDQIRDGRAPEDYQKPARFFDRTYLTQNLLDLAAETLRRLCGERTETSAVFNLSTQFGGGKTHALTLLYHLGEHGPAADGWRGVREILTRVGVGSVPKTATAVFVGTEFDSVTGRGGADGTPLRKTPWGEIAFQLGGEAAYALVAEHDRGFVEPKGDVIRAFLPKDRPSLILMDEIINYVSTYRKMGYHNALYNFIQALSETARGQDNVVLVVSIPASELEYTADDAADEQRFKKMLDRLGKALMMSAETETAEIIRRRLFEWSGLPDEGKKAVGAYADWVLDHRHQLPSWFPIDHAWDAFAATYPFHPLAISVFERKWQALPRFQQTRGILRLLALWVSRTYQAGYQGAHRDPLIGLGTAPLEDPLFRAAIFEQLGETRLEGAVTTDICGKQDSHATRLDDEALDTIKKARLHRKVATSIFFESNGGQARAEATLPEIRLAVAEPVLDIGNVETVLEDITSEFYYIVPIGNRYRFRSTPNLNKLHADRRASIHKDKIEERIRAEIQKAFAPVKGIERIFFPNKSNDISDRAVLTLAILAPEYSIQDYETLQMVDSMTREAGSSGRTYKSALLWAIADDTAALRDEARRLLAWEEIEYEQDELRMDDTQRKQLADNLRLAQRDLREGVWRAYNKLALLGKDNTMRVVDLGLVHSSSAESLTRLILNRLRQDGDIEESISPNFLVRNWPPAFTAWSTQAVRDAFFASPQFPRLLDPEAIKDTIARGVSNGILAYVGQVGESGYQPFYFETELYPHDVEISGDMFIITAEEARKHVEPSSLTSILVSPPHASLRPGQGQAFAAQGLDQHGRAMDAGGVAWEASGGSINQDGLFTAGQGEGNFVVTASAGVISGSATVVVTKREKPLPPPPLPPRARKLSWSGQVPAQKWMNFYTKVLSRFAIGAGLRIRVSVEVSDESGISEQKVEETKVALRELGLDDEVIIE